MVRLGRQHFFAIASNNHPLCAFGDKQHQILRGNDWHKMYLAAIMYMAWKWARFWAVGFPNALLPSPRHQSYCLIVMISHSPSVATLTCNSLDIITISKIIKMATSITLKFLSRSMTNFSNSVYNEGALTSNTGIILTVVRLPYFTSAHVEGL